MKMAKNIEIKSLLGYIYNKGCDDGDSYITK